ncbi:MAG: Jag N-terminal domain-containing protein, partial [Lachnospiraceae bacterium]|nr:Jag N-terminal domain-containing protein [Lachnospiraceae bacterium]
MEFQLFTGKNVEDALTKASVELGVTSDRVEYEVIEKGSSGFIGIGSKPAKINARVKEEEVIVVSEAPADIEAVIV